MVNLKTFGLKVIALCVIIMASVSPAFADLEIDITQGNLDPVTIAVPKFINSHPDTATIASDMAAVITEDLERSGLFRALDPKSFIETQTDINYQPRFADWRIINAKALVSGRIVRENENRLRVE
ncbi:MAG TPA: Tol-Pal system protein TolB, partial [Hellea balneolensis]|nr:Tol-Pal system protein TolB [Hellea balneolensis]